MSTEEIRIPDRLFFKIGDVADLIRVKPYVLRYWETEFPLVSPQKSVSGQRIYRRGDVETLLLIKHLLYSEKYSIDGARKKLRELRKEGELKTAKEEIASGASARRTEVIAAAKKTTEEILELVNTPIKNLFRY